MRFITWMAVILGTIVFSVGLFFVFGGASQESRGPAPPDSVRGKVAPPMRQREALRRPFKDPFSDLTSLDEQGIEERYARAVDPELQQSLGAKLEALATEQALRATVPLAPKDPALTEPPLPEQPEEPLPRQSGIFEDQPPFPPSEVQVKNQWQDVVDGEWLHAYAGAITEDQQQGVVIILEEPTAAGEEGQFRPGGWYLTPGRSGAVRIVSADETLLLLEAENGERFLFDAATREFVSS